ncbi:MAG: hypothetical protein KJ017_04240 [Alphaproteobacteria bacterium]|nr:hypothetical protein [Alphaproteobacteria bacterium]
MSDGSTPHNKVYREPDSRRNRAIAFYTLCLIGLGLLFSTPDYKGRDWLATWRWPHKEIGETNDEYYWRSVGYGLWYPIKAFRAGIMLNVFKIHYLLFNSHHEYKPPLSAGAFVVSLVPDESLERLFVSADDTKFYFDLDQNGGGDRVSWVTDRAAMLFIDRNNNGLLDDGGELLEANDETLWERLEELDLNGDRVIDSKDPGYQSFMFCRGAYDGHPCTTNRKKGFPGSKIIEAIYLTKPQAVSSYLHRKYWKMTMPPSGPSERAQVFHSFLKVRLANGRDSQIYLMFFDIDPLNKNFTLSHEKSHGVAEAFQELAGLPNLRGYGRLTDLYVAMHRDPVLKDYVKDIAFSVPDILLFNPELADKKCTDILFRWAEVDGLDPDSRGWFIDGRVLGFLEKQMAQDFYQLGYYYHPMPYGAENLKISWERSFNEHCARLLLQSKVGQALYPEGVSAAPFGDREVKVKGPISRDYLDYLVQTAVTWPREKRRHLLKIVTDMMHVAVVVYPPGGGKTLDLSWDKANFREGQLAELQRFRDRLFPETAAGN